MTRSLTGSFVLFVILRKLCTVTVHHDRMPSLPKKKRKKKTSSVGGVGLEETQIPVQTRDAALVQERLSGRKRNTKRHSENLPLEIGFSLKSNPSEGFSMVWPGQRFKPSNDHCCVFDGKTIRVQTLDDNHDKTLHCGCDANATFASKISRRE